MNPLLEVKNLDVAFVNSENTFHAVREINFSLNEGEILGVVGESGCGKSTTIKALLKLLSVNSKVSGEVFYKNTDLLACSEKELNKIRGREISLIIQEASQALNPILKIGQQISEGYRKHFNVWRKEAYEAAVSVLEQVELPYPNEIMDSYPQELSVGMLQRVLLAISLICKPRILLADEPTTGLDARLQSRILTLLKQMKQHERLSTLLVTHDLALAAEHCDRIMVMYAGKIVEITSGPDLLKQAQHPYTKGLLKAAPPFFVPIQGEPPKLHYKLNHCSFCSRCPEAMNICSISSPQLIQVMKDHYCACFKSEAKFHD